jgi:FkbM family methyltransferase
MVYSTKSLPDDINFKIRKDDKKVTDEDMINESWISKDYNPRGFGIKKNFVVIDVGAHIGAFTVYAAKNAKNGIVYSYEPYSENFRLLKENVKLNDLRNVKIFNLGILGKKKKVRLYLDETNDAGHSIFNKAKDFEVINCVSLQDVFDDNKIKFCDFIKIDCEGAEYEILFNTPKGYFDRIGMIALEYHDGMYKRKNLNDMKRLLSNMGFKIIRAKPVKHYQGLLYAKK